MIDVLVAFPELADGTATAETVAPSFRHLLITRKGRSPVCRLRLEARWEDDGTVEGEVSQEFGWVDTLDDAPEDDKKHPVAAADRGLIQLYYTPANRDAGTQVRATAGALAARLLRAIEWSDEARDNVDEATESLVDAFEGEAAIMAIGEALQKRWSSLHDDEVDTKPRLSLISRRFEEVVSKIEVIFEQGPPTGMSAGSTNLATVSSRCSISRWSPPCSTWSDRSGRGKIDGFHPDLLRIPALSIFAIEEPENHLSPFFLFENCAPSPFPDRGRQRPSTRHQSLARSAQPREAERGTPLPLRSEDTHFFGQNDQTSAGRQREEQVCSQRAACLSGALFRPVRVAG